MQTAESLGITPLVTKSSTDEQDNFLLALLEMNCYSSCPMKPKRYFFHYHKELSRKQGKNVLTMHWEKACHMTHDVVLHGVNMETHAQKKQPRCIMRGFAKEVVFIDNGGHITAHVY